MAVVHIDTISAEHKAKFIDQRETHCLDSEDFEDLLDVIGGGSLEVNFIKAEHFLKSYTISLNEPALVFIRILAFFGSINNFSTSYRIVLLFLIK